MRRLAEDMIGSIDQISGRREHKEMWFSMGSFTSPGTVYRYDFTAEQGKEQTVYREAKVKGINPNDFVSEQVFYESKDGTRVPMFITRPAGCVFMLLISANGADANWTAGSRTTAPRPRSSTATAAFHTRWSPSSALRS